MSDLTEFLLERIDEDEAVAREAEAEQRISRDGTENPYWSVDYFNDYSGGYEILTYATAAERAGRDAEVDADFERERGPECVHIARHDPARILRECGAKRRIVADFDQYDPGEQGDMNLRSLASVYADHPDFRDDWR